MISFIVIRFYKKFDRFLYLDILTFKNFVNIVFVSHFVSMMYMAKLVFGKITSIFIRITSIFTVT